MPLPHPQGITSLKLNQNETMSKRFKKINGSKRAQWEEEAITQENMRIDIPWSMLTVITTTQDSNETVIQSDGNTTHVQKAAW